MPREVVTRNQVVELSPSWTIVVATPDSSDRASARLLAQEVRDCFGWSWTVVNGQARPNAVELSSRSFPGDTAALFVAQGYRLSIRPNAITISAPSAAGRFYGVQTLRQLFRGAKGAGIPCLDALDYPSLQWRGISDDISRGQISTVDDFRAIVRRLALYKLNLYQPYIEDAFAFRANPRIGFGRAPLTAAELHEVYLEGQRNHVVVAPVFQTTAHQERLLSLPDTRKFAELRNPLEDAGLIQSALRWLGALFGQTSEAATSIVPSTFSPVLPEARSFVETLVDEIAAAAPSPFLHLGGDEASDLGKGTSKRLAAQIGIGGVYVRYIRALSAHLLESHHCRAMIYSDLVLAHPEALKALPRDVMLVDWHYDPTDTLGSLRKLRAAGFRDVFASAGLWNWFSIYPNYARGFQNVVNAAIAARRERAIGTVTASWGDGGAESLRETNWPGYAWAAATAWQPDTPEEDVFLRRFAVVEFGTDSPGLPSAERLLGWQEFPTLAYNQRLYHKTPRLRLHNASWIERMSRLRSDMLTARSQIATARATVRNNSKELDCLDLAGRRFLFAANRELTLERLARRMNNRPMAALPQAARDSAVAALTALRDESDSLAGAYGRLWSEFNRYPMLPDNLRRMRGQSVALQALIGKAKSGDLRPEAWTPPTTSQSNDLP